jgi:phosphoserine phosphatase
MTNIATIISGESFTLNEIELNHIVDAIQHSGGIVEDVKYLKKEKVADIYFAVLPANECNMILSNLLENFEIDFFVQPEQGRRKQLLISDMDSTIIDQECIDEIADVLGIKPQIAEITERAMNGELDFKQALKERVSLLKGVSITELEEVYNNKITVQKGAVNLVKTMSEKGARCVLVSGGFTFFTSRIKELCGFHFEEANILEFDEDKKLSGAVKQPILDAEAKLNAIKFHCEDLGINPFMSAAIGDGANDLKMIRYAGLGVAYRAKNIVSSQSQYKINIPNLENLLYAQGYSEEEFVTGS